MYHFYYGVMLTPYWIYLACIGFWCIVLSFLWYDIEEMIKKRIEKKKE
jgi:hypothetical protein